MTDHEKALRYELKKRKAQTSLSDFIELTKHDYVMKSVHKTVADELTKFMFNDDCKRILIQMQPQLGKSELSSRRFPTWALGVNPDLRIALCGYGADISAKFNRECQRIIEDPLYYGIFPNTYLNKKNTSTDLKRGKLRNADIFEVVSGDGYLKSTGVGGALTSYTVDMGIIDDPYKNREEANSARIRQKINDWYQDVFLTRLHNESKVLMLYTRWHEDDLAKYALDQDGEWSLDNPMGWKVLRFPAIMDEDKKWYDQRNQGEVLFPEKHSKERLEKIRDTSARTFASLYQQRPTPLEGSIFKRHWFEVVNQRPFFKKVFFTIDTASTENQDNDPTGIMKYGVMPNNDILILDYNEVLYAESKLVDHIANMAMQEPNHMIYIENASNGRGVNELLKERYKEVNCDLFRYPKKKNETITFRMSKEDRGYNMRYKAEAGRFKMLLGNWNDTFLTPIMQFPNGTHDEAVDCLVMAGTETYYKNKKSFGVKVSTY